jgi:uncharacterized cupredoxin-like copper-binding protein
MGGSLDSGSDRKPEEQSGQQDVSRKMNVKGTMLRRLAGTFTLALATLLTIPGVLAACGQTGPGGPVETIVNTELGEYYIKLSQTSVPTGKVTFAVTNAGKMEHELIIIQTDLAADKLPMGREGDPTRVDEDKLTVSGEVEDIAPSRYKSGTFDLAPGKYLLICNKAGHFVAGQWIAFKVT